MTRRAVKNILQTETTVKSEDPNGLDQRLAFLFSQRLKEAVRIAKFSKKE